MGERRTQDNSSSSPPKRARRDAQIMQGLLAAHFLFAGGMKLITPVAVLAVIPASRRERSLENPLTIAFAASGFLRLRRVARCAVVPRDGTPRTARDRPEAVSRDRLRALEALAGTHQQRAELETDGGRHRTRIRCRRQRARRQTADVVPWPPTPDAGTWRPANRCRSVLGTCRLLLSPVLVRQMAGRSFRARLHHAPPTGQAISWRLRM